MRSLVPAYEPGTMARAYLALGDDPVDAPGTGGALAPARRGALAALATVVLLLAAPAMAGPRSGDWASGGKPLATLARDDDTTSAGDADDPA
jgi:hypothetical protein